MIAYLVERVTSEEVFNLLVRSGLFDDVTLPIDKEKVGKAFDGSNLVVTVREGDRLIGICRALTNFARHCFVATLAVAPVAQGQGVGGALIAATHEAAGGADKIVMFLHSAPEAIGFYEKLGMKQEPNFFSFNNVN